MSQMSRDARLDETMGSVRRLFPVLVVLSFLINLLLLVGAIYMLQIYDRVLSSGSLDTLIWLTAGALAALAIYGVLEYARRVVLGRAGFWLETELDAPVIRRAMAGRLSGEAPGASVRDVADLRAFVGGDAMIAFLDAPWTPVFIAFIWMVHPALGMLAIAGAVALFLAAVVNDIMTRQPQQRVGAELRRGQAAAQQYVDSAETVSPLGMAGALLEHWQGRYDVARSAQQRLSELTFAVLSTTRALRLGLQVLILGVGAYYVIHGQVTAGGMVAASIILSRALAPIERSIGAWRGFIVARSAYRTLKGAFGHEMPSTDTFRLPRPAGRVSVEHLFCVAPQSQNMVLENISFELAPGQVCGIIGPSGSGKTSLCRLLVGVWKPVRGHVRIDGADVGNWEPDDLGQYLGYLPQEVELFPTSVAQNISRLRPAETGEVIAAAQLAGVHDLILQLPKGYETDVGLHGGRLSGGQKQRLGLARALFGNPAVIVLDEPNANLDGEGEMALLAAIRTLKSRGVTIFIVTHSAAALRVADKILVLREGKQTAFGDRDQILKVGNQATTRIAPTRMKRLKPAE